MNVKEKFYTVRLIVTRAKMVTNSQNSLDLGQKRKVKTKFTLSPQEERDSIKA